MVMTLLCTALLTALYCLTHCRAASALPAVLCSDLFNKHQHSMVTTPVLTASLTVMHWPTVLHLYCLLCYAVTYGDGDDERNCLTHCLVLPVALCSDLQQAPVQHGDDIRLTIMHCGCVLLKYCLYCLFVLKLYCLLSCAVTCSISTSAAW
jgi:hypothetical protein